MSDDRNSESVLSGLVDELKLQAWLAQRELSEPSLTDGEHEEASALARMRDQIRVQMHLGQLDAQDEFAHLESRWRVVMQRDVRPAANQVADAVEQGVHDVLKEIRDGYHKLLG